MKIWPFGRTENRAGATGGGSQGGAGFTDAIVRALLTQASGGTVADASATAALEAAAGSYARAFAVASVEPNTPATAALMARDLIRAGEVLAACGVSAELFMPGDATGQRESWRRFLHGSVQPLADLLAGELAVKLDAPGLRLNFDRLFASDLSGRARAFGSMVQGGMDATRAARLAGLGE